MTPVYAEIFQEGRRTNLTGQAKASNPHETMDGRAAWNAGWQCAENDYLTLKRDFLARQEARKTNPEWFI